jgi:hypothetical protein
MYWKENKFSPLGKDKESTSQHNNMFKLFPSTTGIIPNFKHNRIINIRRILTLLFVKSVGFFVWFLNLFHMIKDSIFVKDKFKTQKGNDPIPVTTTRDTQPSIYIMG